VKRVLAVDWGERRLGFALSDDLGITAQPLAPIVLPPLPARKGPPAPAAPPPPPPSPVALEAVRALVEAHAVTCVVLGLPLLLSGEHGEAAHAVEAFAAALRTRVSVPVELWDERFTSAIAEQSLREEGATSGRRRGGGRERTRTVNVDKARVDMRAALLLLQSWLDAHPERAR
jgi:putative Holliday junction resolvase